MVVDTNIFKFNAFKATNTGNDFYTLKKKKIEKKKEKERERKTKGEICNTHHTCIITQSVRRVHNPFSDLVCAFQKIIHDRSVSISQLVNFTKFDPHIFPTIKKRAICMFTANWRHLVNRNADDNHVHVLKQ